jgi:hypothetical protein
MIKKLRYQPYSPKWGKAPKSGARGRKKEISLIQVLLLLQNFMAPILPKFMYFFIASGAGLSPLYCGHIWPIVPAPDDR